jgi:glucose/arabinose dehydrogenase
MRLAFLESLENRTMLATGPAGFTISQWGGSIASPTQMAFAPDGRLFVSQQNGQLRVIQNNQLLSTPFLSLTVDSNGERGLLGVAFDPSFESNRFIYVYYTVPGSPAHNRVSRFTADANNPNVAQAGSETVLLDLNSLSSATNHNGGGLHFGTDGKLYISVGENANGANAQSFGNLLGKLLRMNKDGTIPSDNPYFNDSAVTGQNKLIYDLGLRNPFTFAVQPGTGKIFINDVGQSTWEEINVANPHKNLGWQIIEGFRTTQTPPADYQDPLFVYDHSNGQTAITGGTFYNPPAINQILGSTYVGKYFFNDLGAGWTHYIDPNNPGTVANNFITGESSPVDIQVGLDGALFFLQHSGTSGVYRVAPTDTTRPTVSASAFQYQTAQSLTFNFSEYVGYSLGPADITITNTTSGQTIPTSQYSVRFDNTTNVATVSFHSTGPQGALPDGNYTAVLSASGINDGALNTMASNYTANYFTLEGDANRDKRVDLTDFTILASNFNQTGRNFSQGNFDYSSDGKVDLTDFTFLASRFNQSLPGAAASSLAVPAGLLPPSPNTIFAAGPKLIADTPTNSISDLVG